MWVPLSFHACKSFCPPISPGLWQQHYSSLHTMPYYILISITSVTVLLPFSGPCLSPDHITEFPTSSYMSFESCTMTAKETAKLPFPCHLPTSGALSQCYSMRPCKCWLVIWGLLAGKWQLEERKPACELHDLTDFTLYRLLDFIFCCPVLR